MKKENINLDDDLELRKLLVDKIWQLNDNLFENWADVWFLLNIIDKKENLKMKKAILSISKSLKEMANKIENSLKITEITEMEKNEN